MSDSDDKKTLIAKFFCAVRNIRSAALFKAIKQHSKGKVLDVGGWDFYRSAIENGAAFEHWTVLEASEERIVTSLDPRVTIVLGDGCNMSSFPDNTFDTVLNIQVLEHVYQPIEMVKEMARVLKKEGEMILLVPQTSTIHMAPHHYYNFTRFWIEKTLPEAGLEIIDIKSLGGAWSTFASRMFYFFFQSARFPGMCYPNKKRGALFYFLFPFMTLFLLIAIPVCMVFSIADLEEEPNNHLVVAKKK